MPIYTTTEGDGNKQMFFTYTDEDRRQMEEARGYQRPYTYADVSAEYLKNNPYGEFTKSMGEKAFEYLQKYGHNPTNLAFVTDRRFYQDFDPYTGDDNYDSNNYVAGVRKAPEPTFWDRVKQGASTLGDIVYGFLGPYDIPRRALASTIYNVTRGSEPEPTSEFEAADREYQDAAYAPGRILDYRSDYPTPTYGYTFAREAPLMSAVADIATGAALNAGLGAIPTAVDNTVSYAARQAVTGPLKTPFIQQVRNGTLPVGVQGSIERTIVPTTGRVAISGARDATKRAIATTTAGRPNVSTGAPNYIYRPTNTYGTWFQAFPTRGTKAVDNVYKWYQAPASYSGIFAPGIPQFVPPLAVPVEEPEASTIYTTDYYPTTLDDIFQYEIRNNGMREGDTLDVQVGPFAGKYVYKVDRNARPGAVKYTQVDRKWNGSNDNVLDQNIIIPETKVTYDVIPNGPSVERRVGYTNGTRGEDFYPEIVPLTE